jgi:hypothetical protein
MHRSAGSNFEWQLRMGRGSAANRRLRAEHERASLQNFNLVLTIIAAV